MSSSVRSTGSEYLDGRQNDGVTSPITHRLPGFRFALAILAVMAGAGCGNSSSPAGQSIAVQTATPTPNGQANSGGVADTPANPDRTYICADAATSSGGQTIGYVTIAGTDSAGAQSECSALTHGSRWTSVASSPYHETLYTPVCFAIFDSGRLTARVYTSDTATFADGVALCNPLLQGFGLATLPPS